MNLELTDQEAAFLSNLLVLTRQNLREEIYKTEDHTYKAGLKQDEQLLEGLLAKIGRPSRT